ncbi:MAG: ABC transporter ATP-binding protein [Proteobacteria bacterium]|nr:ABC transporter ATP-binding protein [Pseudomonadota bacterium]
MRLTRNKSEDDVTLLSVENLQTHFKRDDSIVKAVDGVSFQLQKGEILGIVGESGSGKSVTCLSLMKLLPQPPAFFPGGKIMFQNENVLAMSDAELRNLRGNRISMIFQDPMSSLNPFLKIETQLMEVLIHHKKQSRDQAWKQAVAMLDRVGISEPDKRIRQYPHQFSGGMRQRVMIAMALLCKPDLLIADEPTTALDVTIQAQILELIKELNRDLGTAVILITHNLGVAAGMTDRIAVMYAGKIVEETSSEKLFEAPAHPYTHALLHGIPRLDEQQNKLTPIPGLPPDLSNLPQGCPFNPRCTKVVDRCRAEFPPEVKIDSDHHALCWEIGK